MDGAGIAETGRGAHIVNRQPDGAPAAVVPDSQVTAPADAGDGPQVAVLHPVGGGESESAVVAASDDHISDTGLIAVGQTHLGCRLGVIKTMRPGTAVEFGGKLAGRGEHDRVKSGSLVRNPSSESILGGLGEITDMNAAMIEIEAECAGIAFPQGERGLCFGGVGEAM